MEVRYIHRVRKVQSTLLVKARKIIKLATICIAVTATNSSWMQSRARTLCPAWETSGDAHETPPNSYSSTVPVHPIAPDPQGYFSTEKLRVTLVLRLSSPTGSADTLAQRCGCQTNSPWTQRSLFFPVTISTGPKFIHRVIFLNSL